VNYESDGFPAPVVIADINGDGKQDILVAHGGYQTLGVYLQNSDGALLPEALYTIPESSSSPQGLVVGDINSDGFPDVVLVNLWNGLMVLYNHQGAAVPNMVVSPKEVTFGTLFLGESSTGEISIYNQGTGDLTVTSAITGVNADLFLETGGCSTIAPGERCILTVAFTPTSEGKKEATLTISSNDVDHPSTEVVFSAYAGTALFSPYVVRPTGSGPEAIAIGDVNGDGRDDVVMTASNSSGIETHHSLFVLLQGASGKLKTPVRYRTSGSTENLPASVSIGDVNGDGLADVVVGNSGKNIEVFLQNKSGGLKKPVAYVTGGARLVKVGDLNNDGRLDVVAMGEHPDTVSIFFQNGSGTLDPPVTYEVSFGGYDALELVDVNHDGLTDIIVKGGARGRSIGVLLQLPDGTFAPAVHYSMVWDEVTSGIAVGDVNGDGRQDIVATYGGNRPRSKIGVLLQNGSGTLDPPVSYDSYDIPEPVVIADVNGDGRQDILVVHAGWNALGVYVQWEDGSLMPERLYSMPTETHYNRQWVAVGDINGDGLTDVVLADYDHGLIILHSTSSRLRLLSPNCGEVISPGSLFTIRGDASAYSPVRYRLQYSVDNGESWNPIASGIADTSYTWHVPESSRTKTGCLVRVTAQRYSGEALETDSSDSVFTIGFLRMTSPMDGETLVSGTSAAISWVTYDTELPQHNARVYYSKDGGTTWGLITTEAANSGNYSWTVPSVLTLKKRCKVRVVLRDSKGKLQGSATSGGYFSISPL